ncbi:autotransporter adhesin [Fusobacterium simiae]|uniref:Autotransporter adhesin n=1 Tax=Fusobacterium simiae TaxID=855 RepID=A0ABT4DMD8_FUSSI|nr:autotransporter domain-containing protein [Fusobacterium simiae]MCY7009153.1 autotransporter adhesin [Fusobacterium simiae]
MDALESQRVGGAPLTPGNDSQNSWKDIDNSSSGGVTIEKDSSIGSSTNGNRSWGLVNLEDLKEPTNEVEILARISPKEVTKQAVNLNITEPKVEPMEAPNVNPQVNEPLPAPVITLPVIETVTINPLTINAPDAPTAPGAPVIDIQITAPSAPRAPIVNVSANAPSVPSAPEINISINSPTIKALNIETPPTVNVTAPTIATVQPVAFSVDPTIDSNKHLISGTNLNSGLSTLSNTTIVGINSNTSRNYITVNGRNYTTNLDGNGKVINPVILPDTKTVDVSVNNNRALVLDETKENFEFHSKGNINLYGSQNMGIDLQGTHRGSATNPAITTVINDGVITGYASNKYDNNKATKEQVAFGFSNVDASNNTTMTHMINNNEITLNAPSSAGMQLKAEDPNDWQPSWSSYPINVQNRTGSDAKGKILMKADNKKDINLNGSGSFGIITVFNPGLNKNFIPWSGYNENTYNLRAQRDFGGRKILPGGEIGRSALADSKYTSGVYNTGTITINGDESVGVGILHEIQEVKIAGTINIGMKSVEQTVGVSDTKTTVSDDQTTLVNNAVGVFAGVATLPVKNGETDTMGNLNTGNTIGTETTEVSGTINIGRHSKESIGLLVGDSEETLNNGSLNGVANQTRKLKRSGSITSKNGANINVNGKENYGFIVKSDSNKYEFKTGTDNLYQSIDKSNYGIGVNEGNISVTGIDSIGFALLKGGNSKNTGNITVNESEDFWYPVVPPAPNYDYRQNSIGFYGEQDNFTNEGTISANTPNRSGNKAVLLKGNNNGITFNNTGNISVSGRNNIAVYAEGKYTFNHEKNTAGTNKIYVGSNAIGIYAKDSTGTVNIKAPIELADSSNGTTIGVYSDGNAHINFEDGSKLTIGKKAIGLFSKSTTNFKNTFNFNNTIGNKLDVSLDENSAFAFFNGSGSTDIAEVLNKNIKFTAMKKGSTFGYAKNGSVVSLDQDFDVTNTSKVATPESETSVLVASDGATAKVSTSKTLTTNTNVALVATNGTSTNKSKAINEGTIISKVDGGVGLYANSNSEATNESAGIITMINKGSAGIFGENNSVLTNKKEIELKEENSAGIYAKDSNVTNSGTASKITLNKIKSAGIYTTLTNKANGDKKSINEGTIDIKSTTQSSVGIFGKVESGSSKILSLENKGTIDINAKTSVGIYAKNEGSDKTKLTVNNTNSINISEEGSIGINGEKSTIENGTNGNINVTKIKSAGIIAKNESAVTNSGNINLTTASPNDGEGLVGISVDNTSTVTNDGTITISTKNSTGISGAGGSITNNNKIVLDKENSVGIASTDGNVINSVATPVEIEVKNSNSVGIFAKATQNIPLVGSDCIQSINNVGKITLNGGNTKTSSVGIYSLIDRTAVTKNATQNLINNGTIDVGTKGSVGIYVKDERVAGDGDTAVANVINKDNINVTKESSAGIIGEYSKITNGTSSVGKISLSAIKTAGIIASKKSIVTNDGKIETTTAAPANDTEGLVGISLNNSKATNTSNGTINLGTEYSTGMYGENTSELTNEGSITGDNKEHIVGMAGDKSTVTNKNIITLNGKRATGMFGENSSTLLNDENGTITVKEESSVGIYSRTNSVAAINKGTIKTEKKESAGMYGDASKIENNKTISTLGEKSAGMYAKDSNVINRGTLKIEGHTSAGMLVELENISGENISGINEEAGTITVNEAISAGMLGKVKSSVAASDTELTLINKNNIVVNSKSSAGMMVVNESTAVGKDNVKAENIGTINLTTSASTNEKNIGILADKATGINAGDINVNSKESVGMLGQNASSITNNKTITLVGEKGIGMLAKDTNSTADNNDTINVNGKESVGMLGEDSGTVKNNKAISVTAEKGVGIFVRDKGSGSGTGENTSNGTITLENKESVGMFAKNNGTADNAKNSGTINLGKADGSTSHESLIGMFAQAEAGKQANVKNAKDINVNTKKSVGMYAKNDATNVTDVDLQNTGTININSGESAGIYAPKANISKVGKINLKNSTVTNGSSAVYVSQGGKVSDTASAEIDLGKVNQNRVAYYVNGANSALSGANIGKISGYGVGVYLQGNSSSDIAKIDNSTPTLNYTTGNDQGKGIIGLYLNGDTNIQNYTNGIKVGDTVDATSPSDKPKYAIGIYANAQGTSATHYNIATPITAGKNGVGIYADNDSQIKYTGDMEIGDGTKAGTGIFITKKVGANGGTVELASNTIKLKGTGGVAVIASEGTKFDGKNATIELVGTDVQGVGVYAKKGSSVNIDNWTFNNHGNQAEEVRSEEGGVYINANKNLKPKMVLTHVINGETSIASGKTVTSVNDGGIAAKENIGLMAEGIKNPTMTWQEDVNFEVVNKGTINFSAAEKSTAIFANSARAKNDGTIKVGKNSTAIYGYYNKNTRNYEVSSGSALPNKLELETTANSKISLGDASTGMYLINAEKIDNKGGEITTETGATKNVGIYAINGQDTDNDNNKILTMTTATNITLGNGSVGLYSKGQSNTVRSTVTNTGNITVGDKITGSPSVAMYSENTNLSTNSNIAVGKDGIAFYGKNSDIIAKGSVNFSNKGVLAYLDNSKFVSHLGNLGATQNTMLYLKNSTAQLDGAGTKVDMEVADGYTGAYVEGNSTLTGVKTIKLGKDSTGLFLKDANFISTAELIIGTKEKARGILATNSNLTNNSKISLSGEESIGIYSNADNTKSVINNGELTLAGKKTLGVFLKGSQSFENNANINIADSADSKEPTIGIYTAEGTSNIKHNSGTINVGEKSIGIYSTTNSNVEMNSGKIHVKDQGIGIYKQNGKATIKGELDIDTHVATAKDSEPTGVYAVNGAEIDDQASKISIGAKSYGFILNNTDSTKTNIYNNTNAGTVTMGNDSVFLYSNGKANITNNRTINANGSERLIGFYIKNGGDFTNNGTIDFSTGKGNIGIYAPGGKATNKGRVLVGATDDIDPMTGKVYTDISKIVYGIGMAADNGGHIINDGEIRIYNNKSIGMYGSGIGTVVENKGNINLDGSRATATDKIQSMTGVYVDEGATFRNYGTITTTDSYAGRDGKVNDNVAGLVGVAVMNGSTLENHGKIYIDADNSYGVIIRGKKDTKGNVERYAVIKNYGEIKVRGKGTTGISWKDVSQADIEELQRQINSKITSDPSGHEIGQASGTDKDYQGVTITVKNGKPIFSRNGVPIPDSEVEQITELLNPTTSNLGMSDVGFYVDTLGRTKPIDLDGANPPINSQLIIGTEYSEKTNKKQWFVKGDVIKPFLQQIQGRNFKLTSIAGSLTWIATPVLDNYGQITGVAMSKLSYTSFVKKTDNAWNFTDGLEQRYDMNALDSAEKRIFNKLNSIGKNEEALLTQAYDEMMGHQYANVQQRVQATGNILDKEFSHLKDSWSNPTKDSNKIKTFGMKGEYKTDTAGVIDYKYNAYGVAYVHENEDIKLGRGVGWYTGIVHNTFKFKDIGNSKEEQLQAKVGLFKSVPFDDNNSLNWTISGDIFVGHNKMERKFLVVDEIFHAKSKYYTYGIGITNEIGKEFRLSEGFLIRPYGALKVEYGRVSKIKEKSGEMKLEVKENDYFSIRPEVGTELAYKHYFGTKTLRTSVGVAYENELGRVANGKNKARVAGTTADWFNIRGEKEDRKGNVKVDLNVGLDNQRLGVTGNIGYDTKGHNVRGGVGLRVIF